MVNPELTGTFAFYGSILLAKMGLMGPLTARQRFRKMVKFSMRLTFPISDHMKIHAFITGICKPRGYNLWGNCRLCWLRCWACPQSSPERPREHPPLLFGHPLLPINQPFNCCGHQLDQGVHRSEVHTYICLLEPGQLQKNEWYSGTSCSNFMSRSHNHRGHCHSSWAWVSPSTCVAPLPCITCEFSCSWNKCKIDNRVFFNYQTLKFVMETLVKVSWFYKFFQHKIQRLIITDEKLGTYVLI